MKKIKGQKASEEHESMTKKYALVAIVSFTILFTLFYTEGLQFDSIVKDDLYIISYAQDTSWKDLIGFMASPLDFRDIYGIDTGYKERPLNVILLKATLPVFGLEPYAYYFLDAIVLSLLAALIFLFLHEYHKSLWCMLAPMFFVALPMVGVSMVWLAETSTLVELFIALAFFIFLKSYFSVKKSAAHTIMLNVLLFMTTLCALKVKQNAITIIPVIILFLLLTEPKRIKEYALFLAASIFYVHRVFFQSAGGSLSPWRMIKNTLMVLFQNPNTGFTHEPISFFSPLGMFFNVSGSLFGSLGFFLSWLFVILLVAYAYKFFREKQYNKMAKKEKFILFVIIWLAFEILLVDTMYLSHQIRYFIWSIVPFILLVFMIIFEFFRNRWVRILFIILMIMLISVNMCQTSCVVRGALMGRNTAVNGAMAAVGYDMFGRSDFDTMSDFRLERLPIRPGQVIESNTFIQGVNNDFNDLNITRAREKAVKNGFSYVMFFGRNGLEQDLLRGNLTEVIPMGSFGQCDRGLYCSLKGFFGLLEDDEKIFLYKLVPARVP